MYGNAVSRASVCVGGLEFMRASCSDNPEASSSHLPGSFNVVSFGVCMLSWLGFCLGPPKWYYLPEWDPKP